MPELDRVWIAYGEHGVTIDVSGEATTVVAPQALEAAPDPTAVLARPGGAAPDRRAAAA